MFAECLIGLLFVCNRSIYMDVIRVISKVKNIPSHFTLILIQVFRVSLQFILFFFVSITPGHYLKMNIFKNILNVLKIIIYVFYLYLMTSMFVLERFRRLHYVYIFFQFVKGSRKKKYSGPLRGGAKRVCH